MAGRLARDAVDPAALELGDAGRAVMSTERKRRWKALPRLKRGYLPGGGAAVFTSTVFVLLAWFLAIGGFVVLTIGATRTGHDFSDMQRAAQLSVPVKRLITMYEDIRWATFGIALAAIVLFPVIMISAAAASRAFQKSATPSPRAKQMASLLRAAFILVSLVAALATVAAVVSIGANVNAKDKASAVAQQTAIGLHALETSSATLQAFQEASRNSSSPVSNLLSSAMAALSGSGGMSTALANLAGSSSPVALFSMIAPMPVGNLINAIDASPEGLLQIAALMSSRFGATGSSTLQCKPSCLNAGDACICSPNQLPVLLDLNNDAVSHCNMALIGSSILAIALGFLNVIAAHGSASVHFEQKLLYTSQYNRHIEIKKAIALSEPQAALHSKQPSHEVDITAQALDV